MPSMADPAASEIGSKPGKVHRRTPLRHIRSLPNMANVNDRTQFGEPKGRRKTGAQRVLSSRPQREVGWPSNRQTSGTEFAYPIENTGTRVVRIAPQRAKQNS